MGNEVRFVGFHRIAGKPKENSGRQLLALIACALLATPGFAVDIAVPDLFVAGSSAQASIAAQPTSETAQSLRAHLSLIDQLPSDGSGHLRFNLASDLAFVARFEHLDRASTPEIGWWGSLEGDSPGSFTLVRTKEGMVAILRAPGQGVFEVRSAADGTSLVQAIDSSSIHCGGANIAPSLVKSAVSKTLTQKAPVAGASQTPAPQTTPLPPSPPIAYGCDDGTVIDILIAYTTASRIAAGGVANMNSNIALAITDTNSAFTRSGISTSLHLVYSYEVIYNETGNFQTDTNAFVNPSDGLLDDVPVVRNQYGADCVSIWMNTYNFFGYGYFPDSTLQGDGVSGLTLCDWRGYNGLLLAHEVGHNLWCDHDRANAGPPSTEFSDYSYGYREPGSAWHDIMAYPPGTTIPYYANPLVNWPGPNPPNPGPTGVPIGQPNPCDLATTITQTRHIVANFRATIITGLPSVLYVKASAAPGGTGLSWGAALTDLQQALCKAAGSPGAVTQIWVAAGTYKPDRASGDRTAAFHLQNNLAIYGGFAGTETLLSQRNVATNITILSGEIGAAGTADNSYRVVSVESGINSTARLDGFTITGGNANGSYPNYDGGGMHCDTASPTIANCIFNNNHADNNGGGVFHNASSPTYTSCTFSNNTSSGNGGGIYSLAASSPSFTSCNFTSNSSPWGGGMLNWQSSPTYTSCVFTSNSATNGGGGINNYDGSNPTFTSCQFNTNTAGWGGGAHNEANSNAVYTSCTFTGNTAGSGGGMNNHTASPKLTNCTFTSNSTTGSGWGGGIQNDTTSVPVIKGCAFNQNSADGGGGAISNEASPAVVSGCTFTGNTGTWAGAVFNHNNSTAYYANCRFFANRALSQSGGALYNDGSGPTAVNCLFSGNQANWYGGAVVNFNAGSQNTKLVNCTLSLNSAVIYGGGAAVETAGSTFTNTIFWGNTATLGTEDQQIIRFSGVSVNMNYCSVQGWTGAMGGVGNNGSNPLFIDANGADNIAGTIDDNVHVQAASPATDTGSTAALPPDTADLNANGNVAEATPLDLDNHPRVLNTAVDRGVYESIPVIPADFDHDGDVDLDDFNHFKTCATRQGVVQVGAPCSDAELDADTDVDMNDFAIFQKCYSGAGNPGRTNCAN